MASLVLKNIGKTYQKRFKALENFSLEIEDKEFLILVGPSGSGKSTALRMIAGLEEISEGEIYMDGRLVNHIPPKDRDIAMVFQNYALYPHMTVYENMAFPLKMRKIPKCAIKERVYEAAKILDIEPLLLRKPGELSGGQKQRAAMGRAIVREPKVFLMDEPLSNLDGKLRAQMRSEIGKLHRRLNTTFIYVTHDQAEAMTLGTRIVVLKEGVIQQTDTPRMLYTRPLNKFVAGFIGSPQMNFIDALAAREDDRAYLLFNGWKICLSPKLSNAVAGYEGRSVIMGVRPEDTGVVCGADNRADAIKGRIEHVEMLGPEAFLQADIGGKAVTVRTQPDFAARYGDIIEIYINPDKIHIFDKYSENRI